jgi:hypothetical protein
LRTVILNARSSRVAALAMKRGKSGDFTGYWQRPVRFRRCVAAVLLSVILTGSERGRDGAHQCPKQIDRERN